MSKLGTFGLFVGVVVGVGCSESAAPGNAELGIAEYRVTQSEHTLSIVGIADDGTTVGELALRTGMVDVADLGHVLGREITLSAANKRVWDLQSGGLDEIYLPAPTDGRMGKFVLDPYVASVLETWGVTYAPEHEWHRRGDAPEDPSRVFVVGAGEGAYSGNWCPTNGGYNSSYAFDAPCSGFSWGSKCESWWGMWRVPGTSPIQFVPQWTQLVMCLSSTKVSRSCTSPNAKSMCGNTGMAGCAVCGTSYGDPGTEFTACGSNGCAWFIGTPP